MEFFESIINYMNSVSEYVHKSSHNLSTIPQTARRYVCLLAIVFNSHKTHACGIMFACIDNRDLYKYRLCVSTCRQYFHFEWKMHFRHVTHTNCAAPVVCGMHWHCQIPASNAFMVMDVRYARVPDLCGQIKCISIDTNRLNSNRFQQTNMRAFSKYVIVQLRKFHTMPAATASFVCSYAVRLLYKHAHCVRTFAGQHSRATQTRATNDCRRDAAYYYTCACTVITRQTHLFHLAGGVL